MGKGASGETAACSVGFGFHHRFMDKVDTFPNLLALGVNVEYHLNGEAYIS